MQVVDIKNYPYEGRTLNFHTIVDSEGNPLLSVSLFLLDTAKKNLSENTAKNRAYDLLKFFELIAKSGDGTKGFPSDFREIKTNHVNAYVFSYLIQSCGLTASTIERHLSSLRSFYQFCYETGLIEKSPPSFEINLDNLPTNEENTLQNLYFTLEEFESCILGSNAGVSDFILMRNEIALRLGYQAGLRTEELVINGNLNVEKLKKEIPKFSKENLAKACELKIKGKGKKTRKILIQPDLTQKLSRFIYSDFFNQKYCSIICTKSGKELSNKSFGTQLFDVCRNRFLAKHAFEQDTVKTWKSRTYHTLRKCFLTNAVTLCYQLGYDPVNMVSQWAGHSDYSTTRDIYVYFEAVYNQRLDIQKKLNPENGKVKTLRKHFAGSRK